MPARQKQNDPNSARRSQIGSKLKRLRRAVQSRTINSKVTALPPDPDINDEIATDAARHLVGQAAYKAFLRSDSEKRIEFLRDRIVDNRKLSRAQHIALLADAYALYAQLKADPSVQHAVLEAAGQLSRCPDGRTSALRLVLELTINYGGEEGEAEERRAGKLYSRDVAAITNLIRRGVAPTRVKALSEVKGEGLTNWATCRSPTIAGEGLSNRDPASEPEDKTPVPPASPELTPVARSDDTDHEGGGRDEPVPLAQHRASKVRARLQASRAPSKAGVKMTWPASFANELIWSKVMPDGKRVEINRIKADGQSDEQIEEMLASMVEASPQI